MHTSAFEAMRDPDLGRIEGYGNDTTYTVRGFFGSEKDGDQIIFLSITGTAEAEPDDDGDLVVDRGRDGVLLVAIHPENWTLLGTAFASTDQRARRALLEDLERRGWSFF
jgi:hypothetical protein